MIKRICISIAAAAALAGASATPAAAAANPMDAVQGPGCAATLVLAPVGGTGGCYFRTSTDYAIVSVVVDGTVTATMRCTDDSGYVRSRSRPFTEPGTWGTYAVHNCQLILTSGFEGANAVATATPSINPNPVP